MQNPKSSKGCCCAVYPQIRQSLDLEARSGQKCLGIHNKPSLRCLLFSIPVHSRIQPFRTHIVKMPTAAHWSMYVKVHNLFRAIQDAPWQELDNRFLLEAGVDATGFQPRLHSSQPFFRALPLGHLHLLSHIRPEISFKPWSGGDWSFGDRPIAVGCTLLQDLFGKQLGRSAAYHEGDSLIRKSVWRALFQNVAVYPGVHTFEHYLIGCTL